LEEIAKMVINWQFVGEGRLCFQKILPQQEEEEQRAI
jgi:hypothetical protein